MPYNFSANFLKKTSETLDFYVKVSYIKNIERNLIMTEFEFFEEQILNYINGNTSDTHQNIKDSNYSFSDFLDHYVEHYDPTRSELYLFVRRILMPYVE